MRVFIAVAFLVAAVSAGPAKSIPSHWITCKRTDSACLDKAITQAVEDLATKGSKTFGIRPVDPLEISYLNIDQSQGNVPINLNFTNLRLSGVRRLKASNTKVDMANNKLSADIAFMDPLVLDSDYKISGKVLILPITGEGKCKLTLEKEVTAKVTVTGKSVKKGGEDYLLFDEFGFAFETPRLRLHFDNLFNGNKQLSDQMNVFLNENWKEILNELKGSIEEGFGLAFREIANKIFSRVPIDKILPA